jgi:diguanylate cyclase (GGDEF)-like protein
MAWTFKMLQTLKHHLISYTIDAPLRNQKPVNRLLILFMGIGSLLLIEYLDFMTGKEFSLSLFYLFPILFVAWYTEQKLWAIIFCIISAQMWLVADLLSGHLLRNTPIHLWNMIIRFGFFLAITQLVWMIRQAIIREHELSRIDFLTKAWNSRFFHEFAETEIHRCRRYQHKLTIIYVDIDNFKHVNDTFGHLQGDNLLTLVASTIKNTIRKTDTLGRLGGDEFGIIMPEISFDQATIAVERLKTALLKAMHHNRYMTTFSFGMITFNQPPESIEDLIKQADQLMYLAKKEGKNRIKLAHVP